MPEEYSHVRYVEYLWKLKTRLEALYPANNIKFKKLLHDDDYRLKVISRARKVPDEDMRKLLRQILSYQSRTQLDHQELNADLLNRRKGVSRIKRIANNRWLSVLLIALVINIPVAVLMLQDEKESPIAINDAAKMPALAEAEVAQATPAAPMESLPTEVILSIRGSNTLGDDVALRLASEYLRSIGASRTLSRAGSGENQTVISGHFNAKLIREIHIEARGSATSFAALSEGRAQIGMASRRVKDEELEKLFDGKSRLRSLSHEHVMGLDGIAVVVHPDNAVRQLTTEELAQVFSGEINNWKMLGGRDLAINLHARDRASGTFDTFSALVLKESGLNLSSLASRYQSNADLSDAVSEDQGGIGFTGLGAVRRARVVPVAANQSSIAVYPTPFTVKTEDYPLTRRLYFYTTSDTSGQPHVADFINFAYTQTAQKLVEDSGFVSLEISSERVPDVLAAPEAYRELTRSAARLSVNFRFRSGSNELDYKSVHDLNRVVRFLNRNRHQALTIVGFTDDVGDDEVNTELSIARARIVSNELRQRGILSVRVIGMGERMPVSSNLTDFGRNKNRRTEVWVEGLGEA